MAISYFQIRPALLVSMFLCFSTPLALADCMDTSNKAGRADPTLWLGEPGQRTIYDKLMRLMACPIGVNKLEGKLIDMSACNWFVAKALDELFLVKDFVPTAQGGLWPEAQPPTANQIVDVVRTKQDRWVKLGDANDQQTLANAASGAQNGQPVIAVLKGDPHGHVALVLSGRLQPSSWTDTSAKPLNVPNSASFRLNSVSNSYVFCRLSAAFTNDDKDQVELFWRVK